MLIAPWRALGHEEWNNLHITYSAKTSYTYPFDGRTPKVAVVLLNHHEVNSPEVTVSLSVNGQRPDEAGFMLFPNGGNLVVDPDNFGIASALTRGVYDGPSAATPSVGATKDVTFEFTFRLAPGAQPQDDTPATLLYTQTATVSFTNLGDNPALNGPFPLSGTVRLFPLPATATQIRAEAATPYSNWFPLAVNPGTAGTGNFSQALPARDDWHVRLSADGYETRIIPLGYLNDPHPSLDVTLMAASAPDVDYRRATAIATPTGFWRGAVSETEGTFVAFPGQENWKSAASEADARALRAASRIYKYKFDGTKLWEHAPGWETWAGDMTPDGRFVAYALNPTALPFYTPAENKLVLLDGTSGAVLWTKAAPRDDAAIGRKLESLELVFSPDARWIAIGTVTTGSVTLVDRATGNFSWTTLGAGTPSFGQVRKLRFSADSQSLFCGSGDGFIRKLRVSNGTVVWKTSAGGWPFVNGLDLTPDGAWLAAGTKSLDTTLLRTSDGFLQWQRESQFVDAVFAPDGRHVVTAGGQIYRTIDGSLAGMTKTQGISRFSADSRYVVQLAGELRLFDLGGKLLKTFEPSGLGTNTGEQPQWAHLTRDGRYAIVLTRDMINPPQTGIVIYERRPAASSAAAPAILSQPLSQSVATGAHLTLVTNASGTPPLALQWRKNGADLAGSSGNNAVLVISRAAAADAGNYTCTVTNAAGSVTSAPAALAVIAPEPANPPRLLNLAVRATVGTTPLIVGFSIGGDITGGTKPLLIRAAGPSLVPLGVANALGDPRITLFNGSTSVLTNDNWGGDAQVVALGGRLGAFPFNSAASRDAAVVANAVAGSYTAQLSSSDGTAGTALAEIYDGSLTFGATTPRLVNLSARTNVSGTDLLIAGFVITGSAAKTVLVRGIGPALASFGVPNVLADPQLALFRDGVLIASNDNWHDAANALAMSATATAVGAFAVSPGSRDAALLLSLPPGSYTAQVSSAVAGATGSALVEVYEAP